MEGNFTCPSCGAKFESQEELEKHAAEEHSQEESHEGHNHD